MKPAAFRYHAPKTIDEAVALLAEVAPDDGRVLAGGQSLVPTMAFRLARPRHLVDINGVAALDRHRGRGRQALRSAPACATPRSTPGRATDRSASLLDRRGAPHRALSDPHPRHVLRQPRPRRSGLRMVPGGGGARRRDGGARARAATRVIAARDFFQGIMTTALREDELLRRGAAADAADGHALRLLRIQPPRRRLRHRHGARRLSAEGRHDERPARRRRRRRGQCRAASPRPSAR